MWKAFQTNNITKFEDTHYMDIPYHCRECEKTFIKKNNLVSHLFQITKHTREVQRPRTVDPYVLDKLKKQTIWIIDASYSI